MVMALPGIIEPFASRFPLTTYEPMTFDVPGSTRSTGPKSLARKWSSPLMVKVNVSFAFTSVMSGMLQSM